MWLLLLACAPPSDSGKGDLGDSAIDSGADTSPGDSGTPEPTTFEEVASYAFSGEHTVEYVGTPSAFGDLDGDGRDDIVLGANGEAVTSGYGCGEGQMFAVVASDLPPATSSPVDVALANDASYTFTGPSTDCIGFSVSVVGDTDGDGLHDFVTGAPEAIFLGDTTVYLVRGGSLPPSPATIDLGTESDARIAGGLGEHLGRSVGPAGDIDGDGLADLMMGEPDLEGRTDTGEVYLFTASQLAAGGDYAASDAYLTFTSNLPLGMGVLGEGVDVDGDGARELLMSEPWMSFDTGKGWRRGAVYLFSGPDVLGAGLVSADEAGLTIIGSAEDASFSFNGSAVADRDGDGLDDLHFGGDDYGNAAFTIWSGSTLQAAWGLGVALEDADADVRADWDIHSSFAIGDVDGGGQDDFVLAYRTGQLALFSGELLPLSGAPDQADQRVLFEQDGDDFEGFGVAGNADVNADGAVDYLVSVPALADTAGLTWLILGE